MPSVTWGYGQEYVEAMWMMLHMMIQMIFHCDERNSQYSRVLELAFEVSI